MLQELDLKHPIGGIGNKPPLAALIQRIENLAINIELQLTGRRIADAHRFRAGVAGKPGKGAFQSIALAA